MRVEIKVCWEDKLILQKGKEYRFSRGDRFEMYVNGNLYGTFNRLSEMLGEVQPVFTRQMQKTIQEEKDLQEDLYRFGL